MLALIFIGLCYVALTVKLFALRHMSNRDYPFWFDIGIPVWWVATYFILALFPFFLGAIKC